jgi:hypothetical protein
MALVVTYVSEERIASIIRVERIGELEPQDVNICGNLPQSARSQVEDWLRGSGYLATQQCKRNKGKHIYCVSLESR